MNDRELRKAMRRDVPPPRAGYWDKIDATLEAAAGGPPTESQNSPADTEIPGEVIRLMDMREQQSTPTNSSRMLLAAAAVIAVVGFGAVAFIVSGNGSDPAELVVSDSNDGPVDSELATPATNTVATAVTEANDTAATTTPDSAPPPIDTTTTTAPAPLPLVIPEMLQGVWREVDGSTTTAEDCQPELPTNFGRILTISESGYIFFESSGELIEVHEASATRIEATYDTTLADTPTQDRITFDAPGDATVLIMSGDDRPGPTQYVRCPA